MSSGAKALAVLGIIERGATTTTVRLIDVKVFHPRTRQEDKFRQRAENGEALQHKVHKGDPIELFAMDREVILGVAITLAF